jgi:hypothetical protein
VEERFFLCVYDWVVPSIGCCYHGLVTVALVVIQRICVCAHITKVIMREVVSISFM